MIGYALTYALGCFGIALACNLWRVLRGPTIADRILALDTMVINMIALIVLYGIRQGGPLNFEAALPVVVGQSSARRVAVEMAA